MPSQTATDFFDNIVEQYDAAIERCVPRYHEMLEQMLDYIPAATPVQRILELGCGSGNLTQKLLERFGAAAVTAVDASEKMIELASNRFAKRVPEADNAAPPTADLNFIKSLFQELEFKPNSFDLIASSISIHHLNDTEKLQLFQNVRRWLRPQGVLTFCDQFRGESKATYQKHIANWRNASLAMGASEQEWQDWMEHQANHDFHSSIRKHIELLEQAGFATIDCTRRYFLWTTMLAYD